MLELKQLLESRGPLYERADHVVNTSAISLDQTVARVVDLVNKPNKGKRTS
jgi:hypothetical protein